MEKPTHNTELHGGRQPISAARIDGLTSMAIMDEGAAMEPFAELPTADELSAEQAYFNDVYLLAPVGYFVLGFDTTILQMNVVAADLLGLPRNNPAKVPLRQFIAPRFHDDFDRFVRHALNSQHPEHCSLQMTRARNQQGFPVTLRASADSSGQAIRVVLELAEGKLAALERSEERFRRIVHSAEEGIWEIDAAARTSFVNPKMAHMLGYGVEEMLDQPLVGFMDDEGRAILERNIARRQQGLAERHEFKFLRKDGSELWATLATNPIFDAEGVYLGALALVTDITDNRATTERIWHQANFDDLTELPNRHMFQDRLGQELKKAQREGLQLALLFIDLDGFKQVNDSLGHAHGDTLLVEAARRIGACVRGSDTVARLGGDEFTVILSGIEQAAGIERITQTMLALLNRPFALGAANPSISASIGIALYPSDAVAPEDLLRHADQAMYAAKESGRNRYSYFTADLQLAAQARQQVTLDLRSALAERQFELHFQPIVNLQTGTIERAEALLRWRHPQRGLLAPAEFLAHAEAGGLMMEIGDWVFRQAALQARRWQDELGPGFQVSINQSAAQFRGDTALYVGWLNYAAELQLAPRSIVIEITEGVLMDGMAKVADRLRELREMGLQVALDNFGTGYSSLSHLKHFGIDLLKLDHSFIQHLAVDSGDLAMCEALIVMAHKLGLRVVAEGVETAAQSALLALAGCDYAQGFVYAQALPAEQLTELARRGLPRLVVE
ncbi:putative bifunctional diguanylate cyclase/phosphodiesterase [Duganella violaceipulchra]|uniref:Diguanylate cyclase (GGDEF)-like protein/PAS domain S-box-containing protein n=1 Tax=Duganella violaceipulchra TaxID=2849652 RepID=A0AA41H4P1_9BURK|nr:EAL domain-containing protein [Duganella violaceicalia]MBV6319709.1 EAL domain-containing protein [Duganella violaceicalia]MCP2006478.1 diguanylate cyclase (GGDEF)-like protein/PAS domain S-box-containing protein [Duganella violaceicalia]